LSGLRPALTESLTSSEAFVKKPTLESPLWAGHEPDRLPNGLSDGSYLTLGGAKVEDELIGRCVSQDFANLTLERDAVVLQTMHLAGDPLDLTPNSVGLAFSLVEQELQPNRLQSTRRPDAEDRVNHPTQKDEPNRK